MASIITSNDGKATEGGLAKRRRRLEPVEGPAKLESRQNAAVHQARVATEARRDRRQAVRAPTRPVRDRGKPSVIITQADRLLDRLTRLVDEALDIHWVQTAGAEDMPLPGEVEDLEDLLGLARDYVNQIAMGSDQDWTDLRDLFMQSTEVLFQCLALARLEERPDVVADASKLALRAYEAFADQLVSTEETAVVEQIIPYWKMKRLVADYEERRARLLREGKPARQSSPSRMWGSSNVVVMFWAASPLQQNRILFDQEKNALQELLRGRKVSIEDRLAAHPDQLVPSIWDHKPHIVHFSGHARDGRLAFQGDKGRAVVVTLEQIANIFQRAVGSQGGKNLRCVVLNACYSADIAKAIAEHVDCVIGTPSAIQDEDAIKFSKGFYAGISSSESVKVAFEHGCSLIELSTSEQRDLPELWHRPDVDPDEVWFGERK